MKPPSHFLATFVVLCVTAATALAEDAAALAAFKARLLAATTKHLNLLVDDDGSVGRMKGKTADGQGAMAFYLLYELTHEERYRKAALGIADRVLRDMRATKFGVLPIKEKAKPGKDESFIGGGPPAMGFYTANVAYILHREGGRNDDLKYIATVLDQYPWSEGGWWSADIDVKTGESKQPLTKPSPVNKTAALAMAAGMVSRYVEKIDPALSASLKRKTDLCIYQQILPAQEADGFWHYNLNGNDPKDKDVIGYFMLATSVLMELARFNPAYREPKLDAALEKAQSFALRRIAPMTDPNTGPPCAEHATKGTPSHYTLAEDSKRGFELGLILLGAGHFDEGIKIMDASIAHFPSGNAGQDGAHAAEPSAIILSWLP